MIRRQEIAVFLFALAAIAADVACRREANSDQHGRAAAVDAPASAPGVASGSSGSATEPAPASAPGDEFAAGGTPVLITGVNLAELDYDNARVRCDYIPVDAELHRILCRAVVMTPEGQELVAEAIRPGIELAWSPPTIEFGKANIASCVVAPSFLSQSCDVRLAAPTASLAFTLAVREPAVAKERAERAVVLLPFAVGIAAGFVPTIPYAYLTDSDESATGLGLDGGSGSAPRPMGLQVVSVPADRMAVAPLGICRSGERLFLNEVSQIRVLENGRLTHFAGGVGNPDDDRDRRRISLSVRAIHCAEDGVLLVAQADGSLLRLTEKSAVERLPSKLVGPDAVSFTVNGAVRALVGRRIVGVAADGTIETLVELPFETKVDEQEVKMFAVTSGDALYYKVEHSFGFSGSGNTGNDWLESRQKNGTVARVTLPCKGACNTWSMVAAGDAVYASTFYNGIFEMRPGKEPVVVVPPEKLSSTFTRLASDGKDLYVILEDQMLRLAADGALAPVAGRVLEATLGVAIPGAEARIAGEGLIVSPLGQAAVFGGGRIDFLETDGTVITPKDVIDDLSFDLAAYEASGSLLLFSGTELSRRAANAKLTELGAMTDRLPSYLPPPQGVTGFMHVARHGDDFYALNGGDQVLRFRPGSEPTMVIGMLEANASVAEPTSGEGMTAATHGLIDDGLALAVGEDGAVFVLDSGPHADSPVAIKKVGRDGILRTIANLPPESNAGALAVANDGSIYVGMSRAINMLTPRQDGTYANEILAKADPKIDCGVGRVAKSAAAADVDAAIKSSLAVMCLGIVRGVAIDDTCPTAGGRTRILIAQAFDDGNNVLEIIRPCQLNRADGRPW